MPELVEIPLLHLVSQDFTLDDLLQTNHEFAEFCGMRNCLECHPFELTFGVPGDIAQTLIDLKPSAIRSNKRHTDGRVIECTSEAFLALLHFCQVPFCLLRLRSRGFDILNVRYVSEIQDSDDRHRGNECVKPYYANQSNC